MRIQSTSPKDEPSVRLHAVFYPLLLLVIVPIGSALVGPTLFDPITALTVSLVPAFVCAIVFYAVYEARYGNFLLPTSKWLIEMAIEISPVRVLEWLKEKEISPVRVLEWLKEKEISSSRREHDRIQINLYKVLNRILYAEIVLGVVMFIIIVLLFLVLVQDTQNTQENLRIMIHFMSIEFVAIISIYAILGFILPSYLRRDFRFILAQKCMRVTDKEVDHAKKINYLITGLSSYNKYLKRNFDLQFDETRVASNIISSSDKNQRVDTTQESFRDDSDKLKPANCLSTFANLEPKEQFLIDKKISTKIIEIGTILAAIIPVITVIITVIQLVQNPPW